MSSPRARTIANLDPNSSYVEEEDPTYNDVSSDEDSVSLTDVEELLKTPVKFSSLDLTKTNLPQGPSELTETAASVSSVRQFIVKHELIRKALHSSIGFFTLWLYTLGATQHQLIGPLLTLFAVIFANDTLRFRHPALNKKICDSMWWLMRDSEVSSYNGTLWYLGGLVLVFSVLPKDICLMSVLLLSWADTAASTVGRRWGKYTVAVAPGKLLAGCVASFGAGVGACYLVYGYYVPEYSFVNKAGDISWVAGQSRVSLHQLSVLSGVIASLLEVILFVGLDDNFTIPVVGGLLLHAVVQGSKI